MADNGQFAVTQNDRDILRSLAGRIAEIAQEPVMEERRRLWKKMNALEGERPMVLTEWQGIRDEAMPTNNLQCEGEWAKRLEWNLRGRIYQHEVGDDFVAMPRITYAKCITGTDYGVQAVHHRAETDGTMGAYCWDAPLKDLSKDVPKLRFREYTYDAETTEAQRTALESLFGDILSVEHRGQYWWTQGLTIVAINLIGLEELMLKMYDDPDGLHALMAFLSEDHIRTVDWYEQNGILSPNNEDDYIGSGGGGYTDLLPQRDYIAGQPARAIDMWALSESQETVGVGPELFAEFILPYQMPVISKFGLACYGCCEPIDARWSHVQKIPNLRRVSVSPWSNVEKMAENLGKNYVFSRKPNPSHISTPHWDEPMLRDEIQETVIATKGMSVELVMKDVHTINNEPWRLRRWTEIAREVIDEVYGGAD